MKRMTKLQQMESRRNAKRAEIKLKIEEFVEENKLRAVEFQKKYAVNKAADVIKLFEKLAEKDTKIDMKKLRRNVLANLVE